MSRSNHPTSMHPPPGLDHLWERYATSGDTSARDALIVHYSPLVKYVAGRVGVGLPRNLDEADLVSYGMFGLIDAIDKFEPGRGNKFETYAIFRIRGAIIDELRAADWVPRSVRAKARSIEAAFGELEARLHRSPSDEELASELGWSVEQLQSAVSEIGQTGLVALDEMLAGDGGESVSFGDTIADGLADGRPGAYDLAETRQILGQAIDGLPEREKIAMTLYYFEGMTLAEIGAVLGVTESRVSQIHTKAVLQLRSRLRALGPNSDAD